MLDSSNPGISCTSDNKWFTSVPGATDDFFFFFFFFPVIFLTASTDFSTSIVTWNLGTGGFSGCGAFTMMVFWIFGGEGYLISGAAGVMLFFILGGSSFFLLVGFFGFFLVLASTFEGYLEGAITSADGSWTEGFASSLCGAIGFIGGGGVGSSTRYISLNFFG